MTSKDLNQVNEISNEELSIVALQISEFIIHEAHKLQQLPVYEQQINKEKIKEFFTRAKEPFPENLTVGAADMLWLEQLRLLHQKLAMKVSLDTTDLKIP